jgi:hypothetical protein
VQEVVAWLEEYQQFIGFSEALFQIYDKEESCLRQGEAKSG